jgi:hypothetical protein
MNKPGVVIRGQGVAAWCCARLLGAAGFRVLMQEQERPRIPAILVSRSTQALICDVFGMPDLFRGLYVVDRRVVSWGGRPSVLPHSAVVISEEALMERLRTELAGLLDQDPPDAQWTLPASSAEHRFGARMAAAIAVNLKTTGRSACWIESLEDGWLFLIPSDRGGAWLLAIGDTPECLLAQSRLIREEIEVASYAGAAFPAFPRIADPLCRPGWLACGTAALAFDPLCGDGTGNAIREAILASAVIRAAVKGADVDGLLCTTARGSLRDFSAISSTAGLTTRRVGAVRGGKRSWAVSTAVSPGAKAN